MHIIQITFKPFDDSDHLLSMTHIVSLAYLLEYRFAFNSKKECSLITQPSLAYLFSACTQVEPDNIISSENKYMHILAYHIHLPIRDSEPM